MRKRQEKYSKGYVWRMPKAGGGRVILGSGERRKVIRRAVVATEELPAVEAVIAERVAACTLAKGGGWGRRLSDMVDLRDGRGV